MSQQTVSRIVAIELEAANLYTKAKSEAADLIEKTQEKTAELRKKALEDARGLAKEIIKDGHKTAEKERESILAQAEAEAQHMEQEASKHLEQAVQFVLDQIAGNTCPSCSSGSEVCSRPTSSAPPSQEQNKEIEGIAPSTA